MPVGRAVDHPSAFLAYGDETGEAEFGQVLADRRSSRAARGGQRHDVGLARAEGVQQGEAGAVGEEAEDFGGVGEVLGAGVLRVRCPRILRVLRIVRR